MRDYDESIRFYDLALFNTSSQLVKDNKARTLERMSDRERFAGNLEKALDCINESLKLTGDDEDRLGFFRTKNNILNLMGRQRDAYVCIKLANNQHDLLEEFERHSQILKNSKDTLICITSRQFYANAAQLSEGNVVDSIKEPDNVHDRDAIRVEFNGNTVGYVANSPFTLIDEQNRQVKSEMFLKTAPKPKSCFCSWKDILLQNYINLFIIFLYFLLVFYYFIFFIKNN